MFGNYHVRSQEIELARDVISSLSSKEFAGRGYSGHGDSIAASFIVKHLKKNKAKPFKQGYLQDFRIQTNTFPGEVSLQFDNSKLVLGYDYIISASSGSVEGTFPVIVMDKNLVDYPEKLKKYKPEDIQKSFLLIDTMQMKNKSFLDALDNILNHNLYGAKGIIEVKYTNLMYVPSRINKDFPLIMIHRDAKPDSITNVTVKIENKFLPDYTTKNIAAFIKGQVDTFIVFSAHYDHCGQMGKDVYFPGANDNASGVAMVLNLAKHFAKNKKKLKYSIAFLFFSGEELGLLGSFNYVRNPKFPLKKIKCLVNLDMVGSGDKGITVVNGTVYRKDFDRLVDINEKNNYLPNVAIRGPAANSDHYPFYAEGVKSFFIYTRGDYSEYHSIFDRAKDLPLSEYEDLFRLLVDFTATF